MDVDVLSFDDIIQSGIVAVLRAPDSKSALQTVDALARGGVNAVEVTYSTPNPLSVIEKLAGRADTDLLVGAGTIVDERQALEAAAAGAQFLVSPGTDAAVVRAMLSTGRPTLSGALTPSEVMEAIALGVHAVKLFPASIGGPAYLRSLREPFAELTVVPTGGVDAANLGQWFDAGARAVGVGSGLCPTADIARGAFDEITERARHLRQALDAWWASHC